MPRKARRGGEHETLKIQALRQYTYTPTAFLRLHLLLDQASFAGAVRPRTHSLPLEVPGLSEVRRHKVLPLVVSLDPLEGYSPSPARSSAATPIFIFKTYQVQESPLRCLKRAPQFSGQAPQAALEQKRPGEVTLIQRPEVAIARGLITVEQTTSKTPLVLTRKRNTYHILSSTVMAGS